MLETDKPLRKSLVPALQMGSSRISSMKLELPERVFRAIAASPISLPILSELHVSATDQKSLPLEKEVIVTNFINSPLLSTVRIRDILLESFEFRWENLLHLYLDNQPPSQIARALTLAPNLHTLHATQIVEGCGDVPFHMEPHAKLQHIKFSEFYDDGDGDGWNAFNGLNLPGLKTLELIMGSEKPIVGHWNTLFPSIGGVSNLLQELSISCAGLQEPDVIGALASFSDLRTLKLHDNIWYRDHEVFELGGSEVDFSPQVAFEALETRWNKLSSSTGGCMTLESFTLSAYGDSWELTEEHGAMVEMWKDRGLEVVIGSSESEQTFASIVTNLLLRGPP
ncbi:hypothetical protein DFP72DRAFT_850214 [Ephemerocybe angulata]|uniref:Uncharacterized protein n=1 Tax=Ephemerocybe angulata TaxID=980116 RepID=A0A8H6M4M7_9AGAR|nr:hypothetical protein DFP72DRAFT_850214 [Tulosesus angulatus]